MLQQQGHPVPAHRIDLPWQELQKTAAQTEPQEFRLAFSEALIESLVEEAISYCRSAGLKNDDPETMPIATLLNDAWEQFLEEPAAFRKWEEAQIETLRAGLVSEH